MTPPRIALLLELPAGEDDTPALRRLLKRLLRSFGIRCIGIRPPAETATFKEDQDHGLRDKR